jgi:hypothetical protein
MPGRFVHLHALSLDNVPLADRDVLLIHRLKGLRELRLANTGISNEGYVCASHPSRCWIYLPSFPRHRIFHLVALRPSLTHLTLSSNPALTDDAVPALALLDRLRFLALAGTAVAMPGLRHLARASQLVRACALELPPACEQYLDSASFLHLTFQVFSVLWHCARQTCTRATSSHPRRRSSRRHRPYAL